MHKITLSVKGYPKCPIAVVLDDDDLRYWTSKVEHIAAFTAIFSCICTAHPIAVVLDDVDVPYWTSKVEHIVAFAAISATFVLRMRRNGYL